jgi:anti-sigma28 factor (negative regulator of flagellin synthesis)
MSPDPNTVADSGGQHKEAGWTRKAMSRDEEVVRRGMMAYEATRADLVEELKAGIWSGAYDPDIDEVAAAVIAERESERESLVAEAEAVAKMGGAGNR